MTPSGTRGVLNDARYFGDAALASAFVARWCWAKVETVGGVFQVREDELAPRVGSGLHRTPSAARSGRPKNWLPSGTRGRRWAVMGWAWKPEGDLNVLLGLALAGVLALTAPIAAQTRSVGTT
jgi:hypothetical protein